MIVKIDEKEVDAKTLKVIATVRFSTADKLNLEPKEVQLPCFRMNKYSPEWCPEIDIETGKITNWKVGIKAKIKVGVENFGWELEDKNNKVLMSVADVEMPSLFCINKDENNGYIYNIMRLNINEDGIIENWKFNIDDLI